MQRKIGIAVAAIAMVAVSTTIALAAITFHSGPTVVFNSDGSATATGNLSGLGNTPATATLQVTTSFRYTCQNKGGNVAPGQNSVEVIGQPGTQTLSSTDKNGRADLSVTAPAAVPSPTVSGTTAGCPNGNWTGVNPVQVGPASATLTITQGGQVIFGPMTFFAS
jgi:hypothetical protein